MRFGQGALKASLCIAALVACSGPYGGVSQTRQMSALTPSEHRAGPHGLEGWTLEGPIPDAPNDKFPFILVIARNGKEIRRFHGSAFIWKWMFLEDAKRVAYESGPLHFGLTCILADLDTGKELSAYDCFRELPADAPDWVKTLEANP